MSYYTRKKVELRQEAIDWQLDFSKRACVSWDELYYWGAYFERLGKRYGLLKEFRENGIC